MPVKKFIPIASAFNVKIYAPDDGCVSFFNSPFSAHRKLEAVDIYPSKAKFGDEAVCPVSGVVKAVKKYPSPTLYPNKLPLYEYLILIECTDNPEIYAKILHARPLVSIDDVIHVGDTIGILSRSGYIPFWVDPHIHAELRNYKDPIRARGAYQLEILNTKQSKMPISKSTPESDLAGTVTHVEPRYAMIRPKKDNWENVGNFSGLKVRVGSSVGILDGGVPHMGYGGVLVNEKIRKGDPVSLAGTKIGEVTEPSNGVAIFKIKNFKVTANNSEFRGISSRLHLKNERGIKLVPLRTGCVNLNINANVTIKTNININSSSSIQA